ncbi:hypothetical protein [Sporocytophaga myxococcoides]|uniref:hypothetical protein n=1 Tax=Sporocytophaga myxococcoides TaxID=153721 RepID=UPI00041E8D46|nr:hypothetical protein [Sporocytophaga myxococcoides]
MHLQLTDTIEKELKEIIKYAMHSDQLDPAKLRMVILSPDNGFEKLNVYIRNDWDTYFDEETLTVIGKINISEWLDLADAALEKQSEVSSSYIEHAKAYQSKYKVVSPSITFGHLHILEEAYQEYLICLREELFFQIEAAIRAVAVSFSPEDFSYVVGFATFKIPYNLEYNLTIQGFNHPMGEGPFYKARLSLPNYQVSRPYLKIYKSGFQLFLPNEALYEKSEKKSEALTLDISEIIYAWVEGDEIKIRLVDEFANWELSAELNDIEKGELSNEETFEVFKNFLNQHSEKILDINMIPDPLLDITGFQYWLDSVLECNFRISYKNLHTIFSYSEKAFRLYLQLLPKTVEQYQQAEDYLASKLFYLGRFQESYDLLSKSKNISVSDSIQLLVSLFLLNKKEEYDALKTTIVANKEQVTIELLNTLWLLRENLSSDYLEKVEADLYPLLAEYKNITEHRLLSVIFTKVYVLLNQPDKALFYLQHVPAYESFEQMLIKQELSDADYIIDAYDLLLKEKIQNKEAEASMNKNALVVSENIKAPIEKSKYEYSYYLNHKIRIEGYKWVCPIKADTFIAIQNDGNKYVLLLGKLTDEKILNILQSEELQGKPEVSSCLYSNGVLYMPYEEVGIITYSVTVHSIEKRDVIYKNKSVKPKYESVALTNEYLYVSNNGYLEIYTLNNPDVCISKALYIVSGYKLFIHQNLLVVCADAGLLILIDISNKIKPFILSTLIEGRTPANIHLEFIDNFMVSQSVFDISNPSAPKWICYVGEELAPTYYFAPKPEVPIISTGEEFLLRTLNIKNEQPSYTNWLESLNSENHIYERAIGNLATAYCDDVLVTYSGYEIIFWEKGLSPPVEKIDIHTEVEALVNRCFQYLIENYPDFCIGKVHLHYKPLYREIEIAFHESSSLAVMANTAKPHELPIVFSSLYLHPYCTIVQEREFDPLFMQLVYDGNAIIKKLIHEPLFVHMAARHVLVITDREATYLYNSSKYWSPFRSQYKETKQDTIEQIILSRNENLIKKLRDKIAEDTVSLNELLEILNKRIYIPSNHSGLTNKFAPRDEDSDLRSMLGELFENENLGDSGFVPTYILRPTYAPEYIEREVKAQNGYYENNDETYELRTTAFKILCSHPDRKLVREIVFNGIKFGLLHYDLKDLPAVYSVDHLLTGQFVNNTHGLWDEFGKDSDVRYFLMSNLNLFDDFLQLRIVYNCGHLSHPTLLEYLRLNIAEGFNYDTYKGYNSGIDCSTLPAEVLRPLEQELLERLTEFETASDTSKHREAEQQIAIVYAMLYKLGHERMPELVQKKITKALKVQEQYDSLFDEDEEYEDENVFLVSIYREQKLKRLINYYAQNQGPLWPLEEALEPYKNSWRNTIEQLWEKGSKEFGPDFITNYVLLLSENIALDTDYEHDRILAQQIITYAYHHIQNRPELASLVEPLVLSTLQHQEKFKEKTDVPALKEKAKLTLLQAAWNDLKNKDWDLAEQKAIATLVIDPNFAQVYFLQARLLWLREGVDAYLTKQNSYIDKASHDVITLARLYNLSGCAMDVENRYEEALVYFKKAALIAPHDPMYVANVAEIYYKLRKPKEALKHAIAARANGNQGDILKEIIDNKGIIASSEKTQKDFKQEIPKRNEIKIEVKDLSTKESILDALTQMEAAVSDWENFAKVLIFSVIDLKGKALEEPDFFAEAIKHEDSQDKIQSIIEKFIQYPKVKYIYRNPEETALCYAVFELAKMGEDYLDTIFKYLAAIDMDHDVFNIENLIPLLEEMYSQNVLLGKMKAISENLSEWYKYYLKE